MYIFLLVHFLKVGLTKYDDQEKRAHRLYTESTPNRGLVDGPCTVFSNYIFLLVICTFSYLYRRPGCSKFVKGGGAPSAAVHGEYIKPRFGGRAVYRFFRSNLTCFSKAANCKKSSETLRIAMSPFSAQLVWWTGRVPFFQITFYQIMARFGAKHERPTSV